MFGNLNLGSILVQGFFFFFFELAYKDQTHFR